MGNISIEPQLCTGFFRNCERNDYTVPIALVWSVSGDDLCQEQVCAILYAADFLFFEAVLEV